MKKISTVLLSAIFIVSGFMATPESTKAASLSVVTSVLPDATIGQPYSTQLQASGGIAPYTWSYTNTSYPSGCCALGLIDNAGVFNTQAGSIVQTPAGTFYWNVIVTDAVGTTSSKRVYLTVKEETICSVTSFYADPYQFVTGDDTILRWTTEGCNDVALVSTNASSSIFSQALSTKVDGSYNVGQQDTPGTYYYRLAASADELDTVVNAPVTATTTFVVSQSNPAPVYDNSYYGYPPKNVISNGTVYLIDGRTRQPYTSAAAFLSYSFNSWANVTQASYNDLALPLLTGSDGTSTLFVQPRNGSLINDNGTVYIITNGVRQGFASEQVFREFGYSFSNVIPGDTSFMTTFPPLTSSTQGHPPGTVVNQDGTLYYMNAHGNKYGIPNMDTFYSWGLKLYEVVPANFHDRQVGATSNLITRATNQFNL